MTPRSPPNPPQYLIPWMVSMATHSAHSCSLVSIPWICGNVTMSPDRAAFNKWYNRRGVTQISKYWWPWLRWSAQSFYRCLAWYHTEKAIIDRVFIEGTQGGFTMKGFLGNSGSLINVYTLACSHIISCGPLWGLWSAVVSKAAFEAPISWQGGSLMWWMWWESIGLRNANLGGREEALEG